MFIKAIIKNTLKVFKLDKLSRYLKKKIINERGFEAHYDYLYNNISSIKVKRPIAIITTYNDHDIIESILRENDKAEIDQLIIDNWSTDGTWDLITKVSKECNGIIDVIRYPIEGPSLNFNWRELLKLKANLALKYPGRWIIHQDSDEFTTSIYNDVSLPVLLNSIENIGYNVVSLRMLDFRPIDESFTIGNPIEHFRYYDISKLKSYEVQNKIWLQEDKLVDLWSEGGHEVKFNGRKIFPFRLPRFHYSVRSTDHALSKYSPKRISRSETERKELGWHAHIDMKLEEDIIYRKENLIRYSFEALDVKNNKLFHNDSANIINFSFILFKNFISKVYS